MVDSSIVNETYPEANWNRQTDRRTGRQADGRTGIPVYWGLCLQKFQNYEHALYILNYDTLENRRITLTKRLGRNGKMTKH